MTCWWKKLAAALSGCAMLAGTAFAVPSGITYTGELMAENGLPYNGNAAVVVRIFDSMMAETELASEDMGDMSISGGVLDVELTTLSNYAGSMDNLWLEFEIDGETLSPRQRLNSVPFATRAGDANTLAGLPATAYLNSATGVDPEALPTNGLSQVSNNAISNEFQNVAYNWGEEPQMIRDFPGVPTQAVITTDETGSTYLTSLTIFTQFTLDANSTITLVLIPPPGTGIAPVTLIDDSTEYLSGTYADSWSAGEIPELAPLINTEVEGDWVLTITDVTDDLAGDSQVGTLDSFDVEYDVVRSDEIQISGDATITGNLEIQGTINGRPVNTAADTYTLYGTRNCAEGDVKLFDGRVFGPYHNHSGSGRMDCIPPDDPGPSVGGSTYDIMYGASLANFGNIPNPNGIGGNPGIYCAECMTEFNGPCLDIWGTQTCPDGFKATRQGYAFGSYYQHNSPMERICIDLADFETGLPDNQGYMYPAAIWSSGNETNYPTSRALKCAQCCRDFD